MTPRTTDRPDEYSDVKPMFASLRELDDDDPARRQLRGAIITRCLPLAEHIARRFDRRGEPFDDLVQVASVGLVNAVDRYDVDRGSDFLAFAVPTIMGEVRRHFRDTGWAVRVPRRLKELHLDITKASSTLSQRLGRSPTTREMAAELGVGEDDVAQGLQAASGYQTLSVDAVVGSSESGSTLGDLLGDDDAALTGVEDHETLRVILEGLPARERTVLLLRFFGNQTQSQIASRIGVSQMHVSRILSDTLARLREQSED
ncbi:SigB/SigF/SigG family RNA polymerase sigma factor [Rhodococcus sp. SGAir0479]|uniref:SigB/SigF/SigG family RNA polymerase sigma factor n=1 Tax=Rhodococcus sp. SGAir0479 TaxID=2567884 RepID=UPI0010CD0ABA|nr:SigB/SigF/SigG family RNA polymerase sigma factor [Rhodococcus sp. SGAir0479]QCQ91360.1 SigB/SigF/SigG family RNA polymerase sigma factor [Rhodococcus sp. SGAir0479]